MLAHEEKEEPPPKRQHIEHSDELRACVVRMHDKGMSWSRIEELSDLPLATAQSIVRTHEQEDRTEKKHKGGAHHTTVTDEVKQHIIDTQESDAVFRLRDLANSVEENLHTTAPSLNTVWRILRNDGFSTKRVQQYATDRNTQATKEKRAKWCAEVGPTLRAETAVFIDETPFSFCIMRTRGRSRKGQPALGVVPAIRGRNHTVIAAISPVHGLLHYEIKVTEAEEVFVRKRSKQKAKTAPRGVDRERFRAFLINLFDKLKLLPPLHPPSPFTLLFDNARIHTGDIQESIFQAGHQQQFIPAWSPELNPIEYVFSK
jgi:transposase